MNNFAFVFPGQGSQAIGMLDQFANNVVIKNTLKHASQVLSFDIEHLISQGPKELLNLTVNTQPIILAVSVAYYRAWLDAGGSRPTVVAGHSLGEYSALVAAEVIDFEEALKILRFRGQAMQDVMPVGQGGMAAILGLTKELVLKICMEAAEDEIVEAANFNCPDQIVIAGHKNALLRAAELAKTYGAKRVIELPVSAPFHCSLLSPVSDQLEKFIEKTNFFEPVISVINNVDVKINNSSIEIKDALVRQVANPVRWTEIIEKISLLKNNCVIECGPGKILTSLTRRIDNNLSAYSIDSEASIVKIFEVLS